jgi:hypothetical protein
MNCTYVIHIILYQRYFYTELITFVCGLTFCISYRAFLLHKLRNDEKRRRCRRSQSVELDAREYFFFFLLSA